MSIEAMTWAFAQNDLKPATKLLLVFLANCHNGHTKRCDPSQELLASQCGMSRSTVNVHLTLLETQGLIHRQQRANKHTKKQMRTSYKLGCDDGPKDQKTGPCPKSGHGKNGAKTGKAVSGNRTWKKGKAVSGKRAIPCPENGHSRVRTVGHKPERNLKEPLRAQGTKPYFTSDEQFDAREIAKAIKSGKSILSEYVSPRIRFCIAENEMLTAEQITANGLTHSEDAQ